MAGALAAGAGVHSLLSTHRAQRKACLAHSNLSAQLSMHSVLTGDNHVEGLGVADQLHGPAEHNGGGGRDGSAESWVSCRPCQQSRRCGAAAHKCGGQEGILLGAGAGTSSTRRLLWPPPVGSALPTIDAPHHTQPQAHPSSKGKRGQEGWETRERRAHALSMYMWLSSTSG